MGLIGFIHGNLMKYQKKKVENVTKWDNIFALKLVDHHLLPDMKFNGDCLVNNNTSIPKKVINLYISYRLSPLLRNLNTNFILNKCLFRSVELTKNADPDKYKYSSYDIEFDSRWEFLITDGSIGKNFNIFGVDMSS